MLKPQEHFQESSLLGKAKSEAILKMTAISDINKTNAMKPLAKHLNLSTQVEQPFHHRQCYFNKHKFRKSKQITVNLTKTIQVLNKDTNGIGQMKLGDKKVLTKVINLGGENENEYILLSGEGTSDKLGNELTYDETAGNDAKKKWLRKDRKCEKKMCNKLNLIETDEEDSKQESNTDSDTSIESLFSKNSSKDKLNTNQDIVSRKEDAEFKELKSLLLKFERNASNQSSDLEISESETIDSGKSKLILCGCIKQQIIHIFF